MVCKLAAGVSDGRGVGVGVGDDCSGDAKGGDRCRVAGRLVSVFISSVVVART